MYSFYINRYLCILMDGKVTPLVEIGYKLQEYTIYTLFKLRNVVGSRGVAILQGTYTDNLLCGGCYLTGAQKMVVTD